MKSRNNSRPTWNHVKAKLADLDHAGLIGLVQNLYAASKDNQAFLHARFSLSDDVLKPYQGAVDRWLWPDVFKNQFTSVAKAKKARFRPGHGGRHLRLGAGACAPAAPGTPAE
jgi:hypothetical protein